jgi:hypothetical protein
MVGGKLIPKPFNENDVTVWNALICKHICQTRNTKFSEPDFLGDVIDDRIMPIGAYNKEMMKKTRAGEKNEFHELIKYCLEFLLKSRLLEIKKEKNSKGLEGSYFATDRLRSICPEIGKVIMPGIESMLDAEREIRKKKGYGNIVKFLEHLERVNKVRKSDAIKYVNIYELHKLLQLGVITLYLDDRISLTALGSILKPLLD